MHRVWEIPAIRTNNSIVTLHSFISIRVHIEYGVQSKGYCSFLLCLGQTKSAQARCVP